MSRLSQRLARHAGIAIAGFLASPADAAVVFTDETSFRAALESPNPVIGYSSPSDGGITSDEPGDPGDSHYGPIASPAEVTFGGFSYKYEVLQQVGEDLVAGGDLFLNNSELGGLNLNLSTDNTDRLIRITFTSGNPTAIGGNFFVTSFPNVYEAAGITLDLDDGSVTQYTVPADASYSGGEIQGNVMYRGFTSTSPIQSLTISLSAPGNFVALDNLTIGYAAVPEPAETLTAVAVGLLGTAWFLRRRGVRARA